MIFKTIDGITNLLYEFVKNAFAILGAYAFYQMCFKSDIPVAFSAVIILVIMAIAWGFTEEKEDVDAVPVMIISDGKPVDISNLKGAG